MTEIPFMLGKRHDMLFETIGHNVAGAKNCREAMSRAHLDWQTEKMPIEAAMPLPGSERKMHQNLEMQAVVRSSDKKVLGIIPEKYHLFQNNDVFQFLDNLIGKEFAKPYRAGTLQDDKVLWLMLELPHPIQILRYKAPDTKEDQIRRFIVASVRHEIDSSVYFHLVPTRESDGVELNFIKDSDDLRVSHHAHHAQELRRGLSAFVAATQLFGQYTHTVYALANTKEVQRLNFQNWMRQSFRWVDRDLLDKIYDQEVEGRTVFDSVSAMCRYVNSLPASLDAFSRWNGDSREMKQKAFFRLAEFFG